MVIQEIYDKYKIMPQLQLHQLRVAAVASIITDSFRKELDKHAIVSAALLHDMGNIIKFDLTLFPKALEPGGPDHWQKIKKDFINKFGDDEHEATYKIVSELGVEKKVEKKIRAYGFSKGRQTSETSDFNIKIAAYSDHRVSVNGVEPLMDRFQEKMDRSSGDFIRYMKTIIPYWQEIEKQIFEKCEIEPNDITDKKIATLIQDLRIYEISKNNT